MQKFKIAVSKHDKKFTLVLGAENESMARERVHREWYSILTVEKYIEEGNKHRFVFEANKNGKFQKGQIVGDDIFKIYIKLTKALWYEVLYLYDKEDSDASLDKKQQIINQLKEEFEIVQKWSKKSKKDQLREKIENSKEERKGLDNFYMKKQLDETYKLIDFILDKIEKLVTNPKFDIDQEWRDKLKNLYQSIIKLKKSTNIAKLREIWEKALLKVWELELKKVEVQKNDYLKGQLKQTNKLLKEIGSKEQFIEKNKDIKYIFNKFKDDIYSSLNSLKLEKKDKKLIDKKSHSYVKNRLFLKKYEQKLKENQSKVWKNIYFIFKNRDQKEDTYLRGRVIKQNIALLKAKQKGVGFSYTSVLKWYNLFLKGVFSFLSMCKNFILFTISIFSCFFLFKIATGKILLTNDIFSWYIIYVLLLILLFFVLEFWKNILSLWLNIVIFGFTAIFLVVNF